MDLDALDGRGRIPHSDDGRVALWAGALDELWRLGKPRGVGGPWSDTPVSAGIPSDPYLMNGYDRKRVVLRHTGDAPMDITLEIELAADGRGTLIAPSPCRPGRTIGHRFPPAASAPTGSAR